MRMSWSPTPARWLPGAVPQGIRPPSPLSHTLSTAESSPLALLCLRQATGEPDAHLVVVETDYLPEPEFTLARIVEHAMLRAKDCVAFAPVNLDVPMVEARCPVTVDGSDANPKASHTPPHPMARGLLAARLRRCGERA